MLGAVAVAASLLAAEWISRRLNLPTGSLFILHRYIESEHNKFCEFDALLGWRGIPGRSAVFEWADCRHHVSQNGSGFRGPDTPEERGAARRLVVLGDSFVWGFGVENAELFTQRIGAAAPGWEIMNGGVSGYGTDQCCLLYEYQLKRWKPDEVWLFFTGNTDPFDIQHPTRYGYWKPRFEIEDGVLRLLPVPPGVTNAAQVYARQVAGTPSLLRTILSHSALARLAASRVVRSPAGKRWMESRQLIPPQLDGYDFEYELYMAPGTPPLERAWRLTEAILAGLRDSAGGEGAVLRVFYIPSVVQCNDASWSRFMSRVPSSAGPIAWDRELPNRRLSDACRKLGVAFHDLTPALRQAGGPVPLYYPVNRHWTPEGHKVVAEYGLSVLAGSSPKSP